VDWTTADTFVATLGGMALGGGGILVSYWSTRAAARDHHVALAADIVSRYNQEVSLLPSAATDAFNSRGNIPAMKQAISVLDDRYQGALRALADLEWRVEDPEVIRTAHLLWAACFTLSLAAQTANAIEMPRALLETRRLEFLKVAQQLVPPIERHRPWWRIRNGKAIPSQ
jgi:hypothetical protein